MLGKKVIGGIKQEEASQKRFAKFVWSLYKDRVLVLLTSEPDFLGLKAHTLFINGLNREKEVNAITKITWESPASEMWSFDKSQADVAQGENVHRRTQE